MMVDIKFDNKKTIIDFNLKVETKLLFFLTLCYFNLG